MQLTTQHFCRLCSEGGSCKERPGGAGAADADFILYVKAVRTPSCLGSALAYAHFCQRDVDAWYGTRNRPLAGYINFCPDAVPADAADAPRLVDIAVHEILHTLFFAPDHFEAFVDVNGAPYAG